MTTKPTSTISYNSEPFLADLLRRFFEAGVLKDYRYIFHYGEDGDKDHFHVWLEPNKRIDEALFRKEFDEFDPMRPDKPLGALPFRASKQDDWLIYVLHDDEYLRNHQSQTDDGKIPYQLEDVHTPFLEQLQRDYKRALQLRQTSNQKVVSAMAQGQSFMDILCTQSANPNTVLAVSRLLSMDKQLTDHEMREQNIREALLSSNEALAKRNEALSKEYADLLERCKTLEAMNQIATDDIQF